jgi:hypothetical protein
MDKDQPFTLEQLRRALAAHCLLSSHPGALHEFLAPETAETTAQFILGFALGEPVKRPSPKDDQVGP